MFERRLHPSPIGLALGLTLVALWAALWLGLFATYAAEARARRAGQKPDAARFAEQLRRASA